MNKITVTKEDIQRTNVFQNLQPHRKKTLQKESFILLAEKNVNEANEKGVESWRLDAMLNETIKLLIIEILTKKTRF